MRKLFLTSFSYQMDKIDIHQSSRIVAITCDPIEVEIHKKAELAVKSWFEIQHPNWSLLSVTCFETIDGDYFYSQIKTQSEETVEELKTQLRDLEIASNFEIEQLKNRNEQLLEQLDDQKGIDAGKRFYSINDHEGLEEVIANDGTPDGYTKDVLIDLDGNKKNFRVGWYDTDDKEWRLHSVDDKIDMKHAVYTKLDF